MAAFATPDDLADYLGRDRFAEPTEYRQAALVLDLASGEIRAWTRQTIDLVSNDSVVLAGSWGTDLRLPEQPVVSVASVSVDGSALNSSVDYVLTAGTLTFVGAGFASVRQGAARSSGSYWGGNDTVVAVTYTHGFSTIPLEVKSATLSIAARLVSGGSAAGGGQVRSETIAGYSVTYANAGASASLTEVEMVSLRHLRRTW